MERGGTCRVWLPDDKLKDCIEGRISFAALLLLRFPAAKFPFAAILWNVLFNDTPEMDRRKQTKDASPQSNELIPGCILLENPVETERLCYANNGVGPWISTRYKTQLDPSLSFVYC